MTIERFEEIMDEVKELVDEAYTIVRRQLKRKNPNAIKLAGAYWRDQIIGTVDGEGSMETMADTLASLKEEDEE